MYKYLPARRNRGVLFAALCLPFIAVSCANPADDKPVAKTSAAVEKAEPAEPAADAVTYTIAGESALTWVGSKVTGSHDGGFNTFDGTVTVAGGDPTTSGISINIDATSLYSDNDNLTEHLKTGDFFEVETYPAAAFESTSIATTDAGYDVTGNLTLHGETKSITFPATIAVDGDTLTANAEFVIDRRNFGIDYDGKADDLIRDEVVIKFDITANAS